MDKVDKYIKLLCDKCLDLTKSDKLFIHFEKTVNEEFALKIVDYVKKKGINDVYLSDEASYLKHEILKNSSLEQLKNESIFNMAIWDKYASLDSAFLIIESELPGLMDDISPDAISLIKKIGRETKPIYGKKQSVDEISWCICAYPNKVWADNLFPNDENSYQKLLDLILNMCMCDKLNPIRAWNEFLNLSKNRVDKLNNLQIKSLHYTNSLGTDLTVYLNDKACFSSAYSSKNIIVNMPSYEVFSTPDTYKTEGIVYSSKPLIYGGVLIDEFYLKFKNGKVVEYNAKFGKEILKGIIESDEYSCMLGECALVDYDSPISSTNLVFKTTLFDENASCHLALGAGFFECIKDYEKYSDEQLYQMGVNKSFNHVDFMIGTRDLKIEALTRFGKVIIFENGNFVI